MTEVAVFGQTNARIWRLALPILTISFAQRVNVSPSFKLYSINQADRKQTALRK